MAKLPNTLAGVRLAADGRCIVDLSVYTGCPLCDRGNQPVWSQGVLVHQLCQHDIVYCMQDNHLSNNTVN